jgi:hypothetical protein
MNEETELEVAPISMVESMTRGEINSQIETAHRYPRSLERFKLRGIEMATIDEETAESCLYRRPVGKGEDGRQKIAEGMSIRMAEIVGAAYGNLRVYAQLIDQTERQVVARGMAMDLESNFASSSEVVESTVGRDGKPYSERQRALIAKVALAKARRDATFQVVPKALARPIEAAVRKLLLGEAKSLEKRRATVVAWIKSLGGAGEFDRKRVWRALGIEGEADLGIDQIETLTGLRTAIKDGETTVDEAFPQGERYGHAGVSATGEANGPATSFKAQLDAVLLQAGGNSTGAKALLKELTGKVFITNVNETEAKQALEEFSRKSRAVQEAANV